MSYVPQLVGKTYHVRTFGCQMNLHDSERVAGLLDDCGCVQVSDVSEADIVVFMTCSVREKADTHLYGEASNLVRLPKPPCGRRIVAIGGCIAQRDGETLKKKIPNVDVVFGTSALASVPQLLVDAFEDGDDGEDDSSETVTATVAVNLNFRRSAKISSSNIIRVLPKGTKVTVVSETSANWVKIRTSDGTTGYVYAGYFTSTTSSSSSAVYQTTATALNLRRTAKVANGNVITVIPANKKVRILSATGNWYRVQYSSYTGYVKSGYFKNETKTASVTETVRVNLNLRSSAKIKSGNIKLTIPKGKKVTVLKEVSGNWLYVKYGSTKGYVKAGYFTSDSSTSTSSSSRKTTANVRIRSSRSTSSSSNILDVIPRGSSV